MVSGFNPAWWNLETYSSNQRRHAYRLPSDYHDAADILIPAITEAQSGMPPGLAKRLPMVSRHWLRELKGPMNRIVAEVGPMNFHQAMLEDAYNKVWTVRHDNGAPYR